MCAELWELLEPLGWHCALTGSVLAKGSSEHDLDIILYPHRWTKAKPGTSLSPQELTKSLVAYLEPVETGDSGSVQNSDVFYMLSEYGHRIEFMFMDHASVTESQ